MVTTMMMMTMNVLFMTLVSDCLPVNGGDSRTWTSVDDCSWLDSIDTPAHWVDAAAWTFDVVNL